MMTKMSELPNKVLRLFDTFWMLAFTLIVVSCSGKNNTDSVINKQNASIKLEESFVNIMKNGDESLAIEVLEYLDSNKIKLDDPKEQGLRKYLQADIDLVINQYDDAEENFKMAIAIFKDLDDSTKLAACYNELGILYYYRKEMNKSLEYLVKAMDRVKPEETPELAIDINYNLMTHYQELEQYGRAKTYAENGIKLTKQYQVRLNSLMQTYLTLAEFEKYRGFYKNAKSNLELALKAPCEQGCFSTKKNIYHQYAKISSEEGNHSKAQEYYDLALANSEMHTEEKRGVFIEQVGNEIELKEKIDSQAKILIQESRIKFFGTLFFLFATLVYAFFVVKQHRQIKLALDKINALNIKLQNTLISKEIVNLDLEAKKNEIQSLLDLNERSLFSKELKLSSVKENIAKIASEISVLAESRDSIKNNQLLGFEKKLLSIVTEDGLWEDFKVQFEQIRPGFFTSLKNEYPSLSVNDMKHCSYIISNLKNKDVSNLINVSTRSVETARYRIKKKMNLGRNVNLYDHLQKF